jgi:transposase
MSADAKRRELITTDDVKDTIKGARKSKLNEHQKFLLEQIERNRDVDSGELFRRYQESFNDSLGERAYRNQMDLLVQAGLVRGAGEGRWKKYGRMS